LTKRRKNWNKGTAKLLGRARGRRDAVGNALRPDGNPGGGGLVRGSTSKPSDDEYLSSWKRLFYPKGERSEGRAHDRACHRKAACRRETRIKSRGGGGEGGAGGGGASLWGVVVGGAFQGNFKRRGHVERNQAVICFPETLPYGPAGRSCVRARL